MSTEVDELLAAAVADIGGVQRPGQVQMAEAVAQALDDRSVLLVQAGTGTGKSLAYLVPIVAALQADDSDARAVIATSTLALQAQLVDRDLPRLVGALADHVRRVPTFAALKGRSNYLCVARLRGESQDADQLEIEESGPMSRQAKQVQKWAGQTRTGDRDELDDVGGMVWRAFSVTAQECARGSGCPFVDECWAERAHAAARSADIVVTNHALLAINTAQEGILPEHEMLVVDEAHALAGAVQRAATAELSADSVQRVARSVRSAGAADEAESLLDAADALETALLTGIPEEGRRIPELPADVMQALLALKDAGSLAAAEIRRATDSDAVARQRCLGSLSELATAAGSLLEAGEDSVVWRRGGRLICLPLDVSEVVASSIVADRGAVFTSATMELGGTFEAVAADLGLDPKGEGWSGLDVGSPFDYGRQGILFVADRLDPPGPGWPSRSALEVAEDLVTAAGGRALVLMASWAGVEAMGEMLSRTQDVPVLVQRKGEPARPLIKAFAADPRSVLVGTLGLWQGVDVPGSACTLVVIDKVPFPPPTDPVISARQSAVDNAGGSGWRQVSLPLAAATLAQGAGRLIRSDADRGVVAILDSRLSRKQYGTYLRRSLPPLTFMTDADRVCEALHRLDESLAD